MPTKTLETTVDGRRITAVNTWFSGERLLVDGVVVDGKEQVFHTSERVPLLSTIVTGVSGREHHVEVFIAAVFTVKMMIAVDGVRVAGDVMEAEELAAAKRNEERLRVARSGSVGGAPVAVSVVPK